MDLAAATVDLKTAAAWVIQIVAFTVWITRLSSRVSHLERRHDEAAKVMSTLAEELKELTSELSKQIAETARSTQAIHDLKGWLQRLDARLDRIDRFHREPAE